MQANYVVNSCVSEDVPVDVQVNGQTVQAKVKGVVLELVSPDSPGSLTFRYMPEDVAAELAAFPVGQAVTVTVAPVA